MSAVTFEEKVSSLRLLFSGGACVPAEAVLEPVRLELVGAKTHLIEAVHLEVLEYVLRERCDQVIYIYIYIYRERERERKQRRAIAT